MSDIRPWRSIERRQSRQIMVGNVAVGGDAPVTVQTMTNTPTSDARATIDQIRRCEEAGVDIIRVSCPDVESTAALRQIVRASRVPIVADIHFHYKRALEAADAGAACLRINPGNIGSAERVQEVINAAKANLTKSISTFATQADSYDGYRESFDLNRPLFKGRLAARILGVYEEKGYVRKPSADTKELYEECATSPATYYYAPDNATLAKAFRAIGGQLANLMIVE